MDIPLAVISTLLGLAFGSFLNVCIDRLPAKKSLVRPRSHCDACQHQLSSRDLIPVVSYLWLHGRCRYCHQRIPRRVLLVEVLTGAYFLTAFCQFGWGDEFVISVIYGCIFLVIMFIDLEHQLILNKVTYPTAAVALITLAVCSALPQTGLLDNLVFFPEPAILSGIIGGATGFGFFLAVSFISPGGMGMGDVKLAGLIGLITGFPLVVVALFIGILMGGVVGGALLLLKIRGRKDAIPFGTFLALGLLVTLLFGKDILTWYLGMF
ncbi:prepilin peptidase [Chloroflexota bacterium]